MLGLVVARGAHLYNVAALVHAGRVWGLVPKEKLPLYNVFYEARTLARGAAGLSDVLDGVPFGDLLFDLDFGTVALEVCEDGWSPDGPMRRRSYAGAELVVNVSASPFRVGISETRREMIATRAADCQVTLAYVNLVGANDGLVFDGGGFVAQNGRMLLEAARFREGVDAVTLDLDRTRAPPHREHHVARGPGRVRGARAGGAEARAGEGGRADGLHVGARAARLRRPAEPELLPAAVGGARARRATPSARSCSTRSPSGVGDYFEKNGCFRTIGVALSGGRDSLLVLAIARRWIDMRWHDAPGAGAAGEGPGDPARLLPADALLLGGDARRRRADGARLRRAASRSCRSTTPSSGSSAAVEKMLQPGEALTALARQNVQARVRAERMWTWANAAGGLFLQTSNMSEKAVGYVTIGGDGEGALSVIANVPKTVVNYLLDWLLREDPGRGHPPHAARSPRAPSWRADQEDERELMPFPVLDACFALFAGEKMAPDEVALALRSVFPEHAARAARRLGRSGS